MHGSALVRQSTDSSDSPFHTVSVAHTLACTVTSPAASASPQASSQVHRPPAGSPTHRLVSTNWPGRNPEPRSVTVSPSASPEAGSTVIVGVATTVEGSNVTAAPPVFPAAAPRLWVATTSQAPAWRQSMRPWRSVAMRAEAG